MTTTSVAGRDVPIRQGPLAIVRFSAGRRGVSEAGRWAFWTIFSGTKGFTARWPEGRDPGERFRAMEGGRGYERAWRLAITAEGIRPATQKEIVDWLNDHESDAIFGESCEVGEKQMSVVRETGGFQLK